MSRLVLREALRSTGAAVLLGVLGSFFALGEAHALGALLSGLLGGASFVALIAIVGRILDERTSSQSKARLSVLLGGKLIGVGLLFFWMISALPLGSLGLVVGLAAAIGGFTIGMSRGQAAQDAADAEKEQKTAADQEKGDGDSDIE